MADTAKNSVLKESEVITELFDDNLSDIPSDKEASDEDDTGSESGYSDIIRLTSTPKVLFSSDSESDTECNYHDMSVNDTSLGCDSDSWSEMDAPPRLEMFRGIPGVAITILEPDSIAAVTNMMFDNDFFEMLCKELNTYHDQTAKRYKTSAKERKWSPVTPMDMKKFLGLILLMGQVRKQNWKDYWSTNPLLVTPIFSQTMSRNRFEQIWTFWHFNDNRKMDNTCSRLFKIQPVLDYFLDKFRTMYKPKQELSLDEGVIPWKGSLKLRTFNTTKLVNCGLLVRTVYESDTGYICNMQVCAGKEKRFEESILATLGPNLGLWHHVYQDNSYNTVSNALLLLEHKTRICGVMKGNKDLPPSLKAEAAMLKKGERAYRRKGNVLLLVWKEKKLVKMISTIHDSSVSMTGKKNRVTGEEIRKPVCIQKYSNCMKGADCADRYLSFYTILRKRVKWTKRAVLYLMNCALFNAFIIYKNLNPRKQINYKQFLISVAREWISYTGREDSMEEQECEFNPTFQQTSRSPRKDPPARLSGDMRQHIPVFISTTGKKKFPTRACRVCTVHGKRSETRYVCKLCVVPLHVGMCFTRYHTVQAY